MCNCHSLFLNLTHIETICKFDVNYILFMFFFNKNGRSILSTDDRLEDDRRPLPLAAAAAAAAVATNGVNPSNWRDTSTNDTNLHMPQVN